MLLKADDAADDTAESSGQQTPWAGQSNHRVKANRYRIMDRWKTRAQLVIGRLNGHRGLWQSNPKQSGSVSIEQSLLCLIPLPPAEQWTHRTVFYLNLLYRVHLSNEASMFGSNKHEGRSNLEEFPDKLLSRILPSSKYKCEDETTTSEAAAIGPCCSSQPLCCLSLSLSRSGCSAPRIPGLRRSIRLCLCVKVLTNSNHHKGWEQMEKTTTTDIPEIFLPSALHLCGKMLLHVLSLVLKSTQILCHTGLNRLKNITQWAKRSNHCRWRVSRCSWN